MPSIIIFMQQHAGGLGLRQEMPAVLVILWTKILTMSFLCSPFILWTNKLWLTINHFGIATTKTLISNLPVNLITKTFTETRLKLLTKSWLKPNKNTEMWFTRKFQSVTLTETTFLVKITNEHWPAKDKDDSTNDK